MKHERTRVAVVGGGIGGLCLARLLQLAEAEVEVTVYEAEEGPDARPQGGYLDLHSYTGQRALREARLYDVFMERIEVNQDALTIMDQNLDVIYKDEGDGSRPEIDRAKLRQLLLDAVVPNTIRWGSKLRAVTGPSHSDGPIELQFADGSVDVADVVVGADGAWSKVRAVLTDAKPEYTGVSFVDAVYLCKTVDTSFLRKGTLFALDTEGHAALGHIDAKSAHIYFAQKIPKGSCTVASAQTIVSSWALPMRALASSEPACATVRPIDTLPPGLTWTRDEPWKARVALIGDAAHLMTPFAGEGANLALADATDLSRILIRAISRHEDLGKSISNFEKYTLWPRSHEAARESKANLETFFFKGNDAHDIARWMQSMFSLRSMVSMTFSYMRNLLWWCWGYDYFY